MSDRLYHTRLRYSSGRGTGAAMLHGRIVPLTAPPVIGGCAVAHIDYTPEVRCYEIRRHASDAMAEMTPAEIAEADALLQRLLPTA